jgi:alkane 1-monooxygenase
MRKNDWKYFLAYLMPISGYWSVYAQGFWSLSTVLFAFGVLPLLETIYKGNALNFTANEEEERNSMRFFDWLLYLNIPLLYGLVFFYCTTLAHGSLSLFELIGSTLSVGIVVGTIGINVAHELGHRATYSEQSMAKILLLPALYMHFFIEHNLGHHKNVATDADPASSRLNETMYAFWWRSTSQSYLDAWRLETERLQKLNFKFWSSHNQMLHFQGIQLIYLGIIALFWGIKVMLFAIVIAIVGFLLLECVNYIEHYGLRRRQLPNGYYEKVLPCHSWNSDHDLGRIILYELTRHSDHHFKATRKFQVLRHFDESPQLPHGYPGSILIALVPPLWFKIMNKRLEKYQPMSI